METLTVSRLNVSPRRNNNANALLEDDEEIALPTPYTSPPSSPRHAFSIEVEESPLGEVRAAIPFVWELIPGTAKDDFESLPVDSGVYSNTTEETGSHDHGLSEKLSRNSSNSELEYCSRLEGIVELLPLRPPSISTAGELFSNGQVLPLRALRLPPRLQAVKHLRYSDSSCSDVSRTGSFKSYHSPQPPLSPNVQNIGSKLMFCGFMRTPESEREEVTILGMQEEKQKNRSVSHLQFLSTERSVGSSLSSQTCFSRNSVSSASSFSSSSSGAETNIDSPQALWDSPNRKRNKGSTLNDLVPDMAVAFKGTEDLKVSSILEITQDRAMPRTVESGRELLKKHQDNGVLSYAGSRPSSLPAIDMHFKSLRKEHLGRAFFASRFGVLCSCLGITPQSP